MYGKLKLCVLLLLFSLGTLDYRVVSAEGKPQYERADCPFKIPTGQTIECGYLTVPEDRAHPEGRTIRMAVAVFKAHTDHPKADPVVYLMGGPGGYALKYIELGYQFYVPFVADRDFVVFDQRGAGFSEPSLACPEQTQMAFATLGKNQSFSQTSQELLAVLKACHDRLTRQGINLGAYTTSAAAADVEDLRIALGYPNWNLYGISYGTRLALAIMRDFPDGIRSVVLDSSYPLQLIATGNRQAIQRVFAGCSQNLTCVTQYRNLPNVYYLLGVRLTHQPVVVPIRRAGTLYKVAINGQALDEAMFHALYATRLIPYMPAMIYAAYSGNYNMLANVVFDANILPELYISRGLEYSVSCSEAGGLLNPLCTVWGVSPTLGASLPVSSSLPTLVLSGEYDPVTPLSFAEATVKTLTNSYLFQFPGMGHGVTVADPCPVRIMRDFVNDPTRKPDNSCIRQMHEPDFGLHYF